MKTKYFNKILNTQFKFNNIVKLFNSSNASLVTTVIV